MKKHVLFLAAAPVVAFIASGCGNGQQNEPVNTTTIVTEKTKIVQATPVPKAKVVPAGKPVVIKPTPKHKPTATPIPLTTAAPIATPTAIPAPTPTPTAKPRVSAVPRPTPTPRRKPAAKPTPVAAPQNAPVTVRAEITFVSKVPDPRKVAYKNSIVFLKYKVLSVESGKYEEKELLAAHWGLREKKQQAAALYKVGDVQTLQIEPLSKHPELESQQRNDDTGEYDLDPYWVKAVK